MGGDWYTLMLWFLWFRRRLRTVFLRWIGSKIESMGTGLLWSEWNFKTGIRFLWSKWSIAVITVTNCLGVKFQTKVTVLVKLNLKLCGHQTTNHWGLLKGGGAMGGVKIIHLHNCSDLMATESC